jgi:hypothetical protein
MISNRLSLKTIFFLLVILLLISTHKGAFGSMNPSNPDFHKPDLPKTVDVWTRPDSPRTITAETIFKYMNGAGELYIGYRFDRLEVFEYSSGNDNDILVELYYMQTSDDAFGLLSLDWGGESLTLDGAQPSAASASAPSSTTALYGAGLLRLRADRIYARVMAYRETPASKKAVLALGKAIAAGRKQPPQPELIKIPALQIESGWKLRADRLSYFRSYLVLNSIYFLSSENILELDHATDAVIVPYEKEAGKGTGERKRCQFLLVKYENQTLARKALQHFHKVYLPDHQKELTQSSASKNPQLFKLEDGWLAYKQTNNYLAFVFESPDQESGVQIIEKSETNLSMMGK